MIASLLITALFVALLAVAWRAGSVAESNEDLGERPGTDEQWTDLADAMRRYRKHKTRGRHRVV